VACDGVVEDEDVDAEVGREGELEIGQEEDEEEEEEEEEEVEEGGATVSHM
jgi:hypothetical protein